MFTSPKRDQKHNFLGFKKSMLDHFVNSYKDLDFFYHVILNFIFY